MTLIRNQRGIPFHRSLFFVAVGAFFLVFACGQKGPPLPPVEFELPVVEDLSYELEGNELKLTWPVPDWKGPEGIRLAGFNVYRAKVKLSEACDECPVRFEKAGDVEIDRVALQFGSDVNYRESLEKSYQYRYKVTAYTNTGQEGDDSPVVTVNY